MLLLTKLSRLCLYASVCNIWCNCRVNKAFINGNNSYLLHNKRQGKFMEHRENPGNLILVKMWKTSELRTSKLRNFSTLIRSSSKIPVAYVIVFAFREIWFASLKYFVPGRKFVNTHQQLVLFLPQQWIMLTNLELYREICKFLLTERKLFVIRIVGHV